LDFLNSLDEVSEIATKTKLNIDDTPSFVTVLNSNKLQKLGINNIFEALGLVPGVQLKKEQTGVPIVVFRGVTQKGEVKLMIDGVTINNSYRGSIYHFLDFPIEMVKRIEVIRGAGSILYGSGAISGVINIITKSSDNATKNLVFSSIGSSRNIGTLLITDVGDVKIAVDSYFTRDDNTIFLGKNPSGQTGETDRHLKDYSVGVNISDEHLSFLGRVKKSNMGMAYGFFSMLDTTSNRFNIENNTIFSQLTYENSIDKENQISILAGYNSYIQSGDIPYTSSAIIDTKYKERTYFSEANLLSSSLENNELLVGLRYESSKTIESRWFLNSENYTPISKPSLKREIYSIYANDNYAVSSDLDISIGFRYDSYSDFGNSYSPNIGLVYRITEKLNFKALHSYSFRAPSWIELTSNSKLNAEKSESFETGFIFKQNQNNVLRTNFYISVIDDMITKNSISRKYIQNSKNEFVGMEFEYIYSPNSQIELNLFSSYIKATDDNGDNLADVANVLASTTLTYDTQNGYIFGSVLKYISSSKRLENDTRDEMKKSFIFNQTISYIFKDFTTSFLVKDMFDTGRYYALPANSYATDFDDGGRVFMLKASLEF